MTTHNQYTIQSSVIEPIQRTGFIHLNPQVYTDKYDKCFKKLENGQYTSPDDPRLVDVMRGGHRMTFSNPPIQGSIKECDIAYSPELVNYGKYYSNYKDIRGGQIMYYLDNSIKDPYFNPVFDNKAFIQKQTYYSPMERKFTEFNREPLIPRNKPLCGNSSGNSCLSGDCLTSVADMSEFREQLTALQMRPMNNQKYFQ